jgi:hypothetical protein
MVIGVFDTFLPGVGESLPSLARCAYKISIEVNLEKYVMRVLAY